MARKLFLILIICFTQAVFASSHLFPPPLWFTHLSLALSNFTFSKITLGNLSFPWVVAWLGLAGLYFTFYFNFINFTGLKKAICITLGHDSSPNKEGEVSHFQALATAVSGTVGIGNIGGVAIALSLGGPGATFWIIIGGLLGMSTKFVECSLGVLFRHIHHDGSVTGGPMVYLVEGFKNSRWAKVGVGLGFIYALLLVFASLGAGNMFQANQAFAQLVIATGGAKSCLVGQSWLIGLIFAISVGAVIIGGIKSIVKFTEKIVPIMAIFYIISALFVIGMHIQALPTAIMMIIKLAFTPSAVKGGFVGVLMIGFQRAFFSNEAGLGTAAIAHSAVSTGEPLTQGFVALLEPLIDTVIICTITALVITTVAVDFPALLGPEGGIQGVALTSKAFSHRIGGFSVALAVAVVLFAYSTMISWSYYGLKAWTSLVGRSKFREVIFQVFYCACIVLGTMANLKDVINFSDACIFLLCIPNIIGCIVLAPKIKARLKTFSMKG